MVIRMAGGALRRQRASRRPDRGVSRTDGVRKVGFERASSARERSRDNGFSARELQHLSWPLETAARLVRRAVAFRVSMLRQVRQGFSAIGEEENVNRLFIFTAADREAREHLRISIENDVPAEKLAPLPEAVRSEVLARDRVRCWGAMPGSAKRRNWKTAGESAALPQVGRRVTVPAFVKASLQGEHSLLGAAVGRAVSIRSAPSRTASRSIAGAALDSRARPAHREPHGSKPEPVDAQLAADRERARRAGGRGRLL
jgi:hypothetical protein